MKRNNCYPIKMLGPNGNEREPVRIWFRSMEIVKPQSRWHKLKINTNKDRDRAQHGTGAQTIFPILLAHLLCTAFGEQCNQVFQLSMSAATVHIQRSWENTKHTKLMTTLLPLVFSFMWCATWRPKFCHPAHRTHGPAKQIEISVNKLRNKRKTKKMAKLKRFFFRC